MPVGRLMRGACGLVAGWAGRSGVLVPGDVTVVATPRLHRHLPSTCELGVNVQHTKLYLLPVLASPENKELCIHVCVHVEILISTWIAMV